MPKEANFYRDIPGVDAETEQGDENKRIAEADALISAWEQSHLDEEEIDLTGEGALESAAREKISEASEKHNDHYVQALVTEFDARARDISMNGNARQHWDKFITEMLEQYRTE